MLTNSLPVLNELSAAQETEVIAVGGTYRPATQSYAGPTAVRGIREHFADWVFFGVAGVSPGGVMTESDALEAEVKRAMLEQSEDAVLLLDRRLAGAVGHHAVGRISRRGLRDRRRPLGQRHRAPPGPRDDRLLDERADRLGDGLDVLVEVEDVVGVEGRLQPPQASELLGREGAGDPGGALVADRR